jgi:hypothetical protein
MSTILESERKRINEFQNFAGQAEIFWVLDRARAACFDLLPESLLRMHQAMPSNGDKLLA